MPKETAQAAPPVDYVAVIEAWYREFFCDKQVPLLTGVQNEIRAAVDELKTRVASK